MRGLRLGQVQHLGVIGVLIVDALQAVTAKGEREVVGLCALFFPGYAEIIIDPYLRFVGVDN